jgi:hypothetical protein
MSVGGIQQCFMKRVSFKINLLLLIVVFAHFYLSFHKYYLWKPTIFLIYAIIVTNKLKMTV